MRRRGLVIALLALGGCSSLRPATAQRYFVLEPAPLGQGTSAVDAAPNAVAHVPRSSLTLLVAPTVATPFYDTQEIVFSRAGGQRAYYQFSSWTEPPARSLDRLLVSRLTATGAFDSVALTTSGVRGQLELRTELVEMFHDARAEPGLVRMTLDVEISQSLTRKLIAKRAFMTNAPVRDANADSAVEAFDAATAAILLDLAAWVVTVAPLP